MFLPSFFGNAALSPRRLLILSLVVSISVQAQKNQSSSCENASKNSTLVCENDVILYAEADSKNNSSTTDVDEKDVTVNELEPRDTSNTKCASVGVVFARGATEPGNVGILAGPPFFDALDDKIEGEDLAVQGVNYSASEANDLVSGSPEGAAEMARLISESRSKCPDMHLIVSGYSQGSQVVRMATDQLPPDITNGIGAIVMFGDPLKGTPIKNYDTKKVLSVCHNGDLICEGNSTVLPAHLTYSKDANDAAEFSVKTMAHLGITGYDHSYCKRCGGYYHHRPWHRYRPYHRHPYFYKHRPHHYYGYDEESNANDVNNPKSPGPKSPEAGSAEPKSPGPKSPEAGSAEPKSSEPKTSEPKSPEAGSTEPKSPAPKSPEAGSTEPKSSEPKSPEAEAVNPETAPMKVVKKWYSRLRA